jgi:hypothetical protein
MNTDEKIYVAGHREAFSTVATSRRLHAGGYRNLVRTHARRARSDRTLPRYMLFCY